MSYASRRPDAELLDAVRAAAAVTDGKLTMAAYTAARRPGDPSSSALGVRFGSWPQALAAAGLPRSRSQQRRWTEAEAIAAIAGWLKTSQDVRYKAYEQAARHADLPSLQAIDRLFAGWKAARSAARAFAHD